MFPAETRPGFHGLPKKLKTCVMDKSRVYKVSELTYEIRSLLEEAYKEVWVEGEISNLTTSSAGHVYFSLKDESSLLNCVLFKSSGRGLVFKIEDGQHVIVCGRVSIYDKRGQYQLYVSKIELCGAGALQVAFEQLKKKLYKEGLFDEARKKAIPKLPVRIGIVTSSTGAAIRDILKIAYRRFPSIETIIRPVRVQGEEAKNEIAEAIAELNEYNELIISGAKDENPIDVIIVGRGGGSLEDLWPFNEETVARSIVNSKIPVVSAVGHEIDYTISDFVADLRAPTPSAAAEIVVPLKSEFKDHIADCKKQMYMMMGARINVLAKDLEALKGSYVLRSPMNFFAQLSQEVDDMLKGATVKILHYIELEKSKLGSVISTMKALGPLSILERGYSITFKEGKVVKSARILQKGDIIRTKFSDGNITSKVEFSGLEEAK